MSKIGNASSGFGDAIAPADMAEVERVVIGKAKAGNMQAAAIAARTWRRRRDRPVRIDLPAVDDARGVAAAQGAVIAAAARGEITPREGTAFTAMIEARRRTIELVEYEARLVEIERMNAERAREAKER